MDFRRLAKELTDERAAKEAADAATAKAVNEMIRQIANDLVSFAKDANIDVQPVIDPHNKLALSKSRGRIFITFESLSSFHVETINGKRHFTSEDELGKYILSWLWSN
jgi:hypothetical protein